MTIDLTQNPNMATKHILSESKMNTDLCESYLEDITAGIYDYAKVLSGLCDRAKQTLVAAMCFNYQFDTFFTILENAPDLSPIEQSFLIAYLSVAKDVSGFTSWERDGVEVECPICAELVNITPQYRVIADERKYFVDFAIDYLPVKDVTGTMYAVELDGFEYHSSKKQVNKDYERERILQRNGFKILRFTGSQVHKNPFGCAFEVITTIIEDSKKTSKIR